MPTSIGAHSPSLDAVRALKTKAGRREQGSFAVEGPTMLAEALRSGRTPSAVYVTQTALDATAGLVQGLDPGVPVYVIPDRAMAKLSDLETAPGVLAIFETKLTPLTGLLVGEAPPGSLAAADAQLGSLVGRDAPLLLLAGVSDPGNAGTLLRSAEIFGFAGCIFGADAVEPYNPKVVRASMGAIFRVPIGVGAAADIERAARSAGYELIATGEGGIPLPEFRFGRRSLIAIGNERRGVKGWLSGWDRTLTIPQSGAGESLNAAVAGSIVAYVASSQLGPRTEKA